MTEAICLRFLFARAQYLSKLKLLHFTYTKSLMSGYNSSMINDTHLEWMSLYLYANEVNVLLTIDEGISYLQKSGAKITSQRIAIMRLLEGRTDHPSAEEIFKELKPQHPTLSIATVYSTTQLLAEASLIRILTIDERKVYYDPNTSPHSHFQCHKCGKIVDIFHDEPLNINDNSGKSNEISSISATEVYHYGVCTKCAKGKTKTKRG